MLLSYSPSEIPISSILNFRLKILIIGYRTQGESIICMFCDKSDNSVKYSFVVDSYKEGELNMTYKILDNVGIKPIPLLFWTHPDLDHSKGMYEMVKNLCDETSTIFIPQYIHNRNTDIVSLNDEEKNTVNQVLELNGKGYNLNPLDISEKHEELKCYRLVGDDKTFLDFSIDALTPRKGKLADKFNKNGKYTDKNNVSISFVLNIEGYYFYFGGDVTNESIEDTHKGYFAGCRFVKIPHHGSVYSDQLLEYLPKKIDTACYTRKTKTTPPDDMHNRYKSRAIYLAATGRKEGNQDDFGIIEYEYDFSKEIINVDITPYNNAFVDKGDKEENDI